jgi:hypothetical protein
MAQLKSPPNDYWIFMASRNSKYWGSAGENMGLGYDIFRELSDGDPLWIAQAATLKEAQEKLDVLAHTVPAKYFVRDAASAKIVARAAPNSPEKTTL